MIMFFFCLSFFHKTSYRVKLKKASMILNPEWGESVWDMPDSLWLLRHTNVFTQVSQLIMSPVWLDGTPGLGWRLQLENICLEPHTSVLTPLRWEEEEATRGVGKEAEGDAFNLWWGSRRGRGVWVWADMSLRVPAFISSCLLLVC